MRDNRQAAKARLSRDGGLVHDDDVAVLEYRLPGGSFPGRVSPLSPMLMSERPDTPVPFPSAVRHASEAVSEVAEALISAVSEAVTQRLSQCYEKQLLQSEEQISILKQLLYEAELVDRPGYGDAKNFAVQFVWGDCGEAFTLALFDSLVCAPPLQLLTPQAWVQLTMDHLDEDLLASDAGFPPAQLKPAMSEAADAAIDAMISYLKMSSGLSRQIFRYRDRWARLLAFSAGGISAVAIEPLRPSLLIGPYEGTSPLRALVPFVASRADDTDLGLQFQFRPDDGRQSEVTVLLASGGPEQRLVKDGVLYVPAARSAVQHSPENRVARFGNQELVLQSLGPADLDEPEYVTIKERRVVGCYLHDAANNLPRLARGLVEANADLVAMTESTLGPVKIVTFELGPCDLSDDQIAQIISPDRLSPGADVPGFNEPVIQMVRKGGAGSASSWIIAVAGRDRPGILCGFSAVTARFGGLIRRCGASTKPVSPGKEARFHVVATVEFPEGTNIFTLRASLASIFPEPYEISVQYASGTPVDSWFNVPEASPEIEDSDLLVVRGTGKPGRMQSVTQKIFDQKWNITGASSHVLGGQWVCVLAAKSMEEGATPLAKICQEIEGEHGSKLKAQVLGSVDRGPMRLTPAEFSLRFDTVSTPGALHEPLLALARLGCEVENVYGEVIPESSPPVARLGVTFNMRDEGHHSPGHEARLRPELRRLSREYGWLSVWLNKDNLSLLMSPDLLMLMTADN